MKGDVEYFLFLMPGDQGEVGEEGDQGKVGKNGPPGLPGIQHTFIICCVQSRKLGKKE